MRFLLLIYCSFAVLHLSPARQQGFSEVGEATGLGVAFSRGTSVVDYNNDGFDDVFIARKSRNNMLFKNKGDGSFEDIAQSAGLDDIGGYNQSIWVDYNNDGLIDLFLAAQTDERSLLYRNNGDDTFTDVTTVSGLDLNDFIASAIWGDVNGDGWKDLFVFMLSEDNRFFLNKGDGTFRDYTAEAGIDMYRLTMGATFIDFDQDKDLDLFISHDGYAGNYLYENDGHGLFTDISVATGIMSESEAMGVSVGDFNNDGWPDIYLTNRLENMLFRNNGGETFTEIAAAAGVADEGMGWGVSWLDYDNDGLLDVFIANDSDYSDHANVLYRNNGDETFTSVFQEEEIAGDKATYATAISDFDHDGDMDLVVANRSSTDRSQLFINGLVSDNHWLIIRLRTSEGDPAPIGSSVQVTTSAATYTRYVFSGTSWCGDDSKAMHFGLGANSQIEKVTVRWPDGSEEVYTDLTSKKAFLLRQGGGSEELTYTPVPIKTNDSEDVITALAEEPKENLEWAVFPNPFVDELTLNLRLVRPESVEITLLSYAGREKEVLYDQVLYPGQHQLLLKPAIQQTGLYLLRVKVGDKLYYEKVLKD
jgi:hypothetical protein